MQQRQQHPDRQPDHSKHSDSSDSTNAVWRELRGIAWALATTECSRISLDGEPECPYCHGGLDMAADFDTTIDGIAHAPTCWIERARTVVSQAERAREGA